VLEQRRWSFFARRRVCGRAPEALALHHKAAEGMWQRALKGSAAASYLRQLVSRHRE